MLDIVKGKRGMFSALAEEMFERLFPLCRSITGDGVRQTLQIIREYAPDFEIHEIPSGTQVYDWTVPLEWNIRDAYIKDNTGRRVVDFQKNNVHVMGYSIPIRARLSFTELRDRLHTLPKLPDAIPYRTSYYKENWGFCLSQNQLDAMDHQETYEVCVDTTLEKGSLTYADCVLAGQSDREYLISTYCCHPSLANDNLSGVVLTTLLLNVLKERQLRHSYRFVMCPETIGAIAYLAKNENVLKKSAGGFVVTTVAGPGTHGYKCSFLGNHSIDRAARLTFKERGLPFVEYPFAPDGSDERQYSSPGFRIPVGSITRDKYYEYEYYHTSLDDLSFVSGENLVSTLEVYLSVIEKLEWNRNYVRRNQNGELQLGKRGLYPQTGGAIKQMAAGATDGTPRALHTLDPVDAITWFLFLADGQHSLLDMAERTGASVEQLQEVAQTLLAQDLIYSVDTVG